MTPESETNRADAGSSASPAPASAFLATRWSLVSRARGDTPEARAALSELCDAYYNSVVAFLRRERGSEDEARELAHEFFARILSGSGVAGADRERGRFRSYLLGALKHFLADARLRAGRQKRGAGQAPESLDASPVAGEGESQALQVADPAAISPDVLFDREWALEVMRRALEALERESKAKGKADQFAVLKPWLAAEGADIPQANAARQLGLTEGAVKVTIHRLRKRFGELIRQEISETLQDPALVEDELAHLLASF